MCNVVERFLVLSLSLAVLNIMAYKATSKCVDCMLCDLNFKFIKLNHC